MTQQPPTERSIFLEAIEQRSRAERAAFVKRACAGNPDLRVQVEALLRAHQESGDLLDAADAVSPTTDQSVMERPGTQIGPYKLLQVIGEGGMGVVYMAEQTEPVERRVALKIIKPGMDSRQVIARFEAERQAVALMDHPNIAKIFDAGVVGPVCRTGPEAPDDFADRGPAWQAGPTGRPYFVMELVKGVPITKYCDDQQLSLRERLELMMPVCQAIQHAHQKGIIHRDIKPSNILVALYDAQAVPKVIDFGVAKATGPKLTDRTMFTQFGQIVGTLEYMSPEQAQLNQLDIDTRSDIYSLGVLLYELLTGSTPFDRQRLQSAAFDEMLRIIREEEPPKPSTRLSDLSSPHAPREEPVGSGTRSVPTTLAAVAANRQTEPARLSKAIRGELDWIVMKALEKDRGRRYETANGLAMDLQRYLHDEPVLACPPSAAYRFRKFARRHKGPLLTALLIAFALLAGTITSTLLAVRAWRAETLAENRLRAETKARSEADAARNQADAARKEAIANLRKAHEAVDRMLTHVADNDLRNVPQVDHVVRKLLENALEFNQGFLNDQSNDPDLRCEAALAHVRLGRVNMQLGRTQVSRDELLRGSEILETLSGEFPRQWRYRQELVYAYGTLSLVLPTAEERERTLRRGVDLADQLVAEYPQADWSRRARAGACRVLGMFLADLKRLEEAEPILSQAIADADQIEDLRIGGSVRSYLARLNRSAGRLSDAEDHNRAAVRVLQQEYARTPEDRWVGQLLGDALEQLGEILAQQGRTNEANEAYSKALNVSHRFARDYPDTLFFSQQAAVAAKNLGDGLSLQGRDDDAIGAYRVALDANCRLISRGPATTHYHSSLRDCLNKLDRLLVKTKRDSERQRLAADASAPYELLLPQHPDDAALQLEYERLQFTFIERGIQRGTLDEQKQFWAQGIARLQGRIAEQPGDLAVRDELAVRYSQMATFLKANGQPQEAAAAQRRCVEVLEQAVADLPDSAVLQKALGHHYRYLASYCGHAEAAECHRKAVALFERLSTIDPNDIDCRYFVGQSKYYTGEHLVLAGQGAGTESCWREALEVAAALPAEYLAQGEHRGFVKGSYSRLIDTFKAAKADDEAEKIYRQAIDFYSRLAAAAPTETGVLAETIQFLDGLEQLLKQQGKIDDALTVYRQAAEIEEKIAAAKPTDVALRERIARRHLAQAWPLKKSGHYAQSAEEYRAAIAAYEKLAADFPDKPAYRQTLDQANSGLVWVLNDGGRWSEAEALCREQIARVEKSLADSPQRASDLQLLGDLLFGLGFAVRFQGRFDESVQVFRQNLETRDKLLATAEATPLDRHEHRRSQRGLAWALFAGGRLDEAMQTFRLALEAAQKLATEFPTEAPYQAGLIESQLELAGGLLRVSQFAEAAELYRQALEQLDNHPSSAGPCNNLAWLLATCPDAKFRNPVRAVAYAKQAVELAPGQGMFWNTLGAAQYRAGDYSAAIEALQKSQELRSGGDAHDWFFLAMAHWQLGHHDEARLWFDKALAWTDANAKDNEELIRFRAEATELMKQEKQ